MDTCDWCSSIVIGGECTNLHCENAKIKRSEDSLRKKVKRSQKEKIKKKKGRKVSKPRKGNWKRHRQDDGSVLVPDKIHLRGEDSLPKFFGYKTDKTSTQESRRAALRDLYNAKLETSNDATNSYSIGEFGPASDDKRKRKIISWFDGRIDRSKRPNLVKSKRKLEEDRDYVSQNF